MLKPGWLVPPIIWGAVVGESGTAKTPAFRLAMKPIRERERKALERYNEAAKQFQTELDCWEKEHRMTGSETRSRLATHR